VRGFEHSDVRETEPAARSVGDAGLNLRQVLSCQLVKQGVEVSAISTRSSRMSSSLESRAPLSGRWPKNHRCGSRSTVADDSDQLVASIDEDVFRSECGRR